MELGRLSEAEAVRLVERVMAQHGWEPPAGDSATTPEEVTELVNTVTRHPRALVLLARKVATGVRATTENLAALMAKLEAQNPGDRENSLYASVELSLRRLPPEVRDVVNRLAVFHGGGHLASMAMVMGIEIESIGAVAQMLVDVGLAELHEYNYLRLDSALPVYLKLGQDPTHLADLEVAWAEAMMQLVDSLYKQFSKNSKITFLLVLLDLPNLLALLDWLERRAAANPSTASAVSRTAQYIEQLLTFLSRPQALARAVEVRQAIASVIPECEHTRFEDERLQIEQLLQQGHLQTAYERAQALLARTQAVGSKDYRGSDYDLAMGTYLLGKILFTAGQAAPALPVLMEAQQLFEALEERGESMAIVTLIGQANCLSDLGQLDEAAETYKEANVRSEKQSNFRLVAVGKGELANVLRKQGNYSKSLDTYIEVRAIFERQNEPREVATSWHQIGIVHQTSGQYSAAETAYRKSLEIKTQIKDLAGQAGSLTMLGNLYDDHLNRLEEAVTFYRQAADIYVALGDLRYEGVTRNNIANTLCKLKRYDEARSEILRAIECKRSYGHAATPWTSFYNLQRIETAVGNPAAARAAWVQARDAYLAYRQQGGYAQFGGGRLVDDVLGLISQQKIDEVQSLFNQLTNDPQTPESRKHLIQAMISILNGSCDPSLADDDALYYADAAEILFLIERLGG